MFQLIYASKAITEITPVDVENILTTARTFNLEKDITGCLLFHKGEFLQILEGEKKVVKDLFRQIEQDSRHTEVQLLGDSVYDERIFNQWSMAYHTVKPDEVEALSERLFVNNLLIFSEFTSKPTFTSKLFWHNTKKLLQKE